MELLCPNNHRLSKSGILKIKNDSYVLYKCNCDDRYIYAPYFRKNYISVKDKNICNLSFKVAALHDGINKESSGYIYKYNNKPIEAVFSDELSNCFKCDNKTKSIVFVIPHKDKPCTLVAGRFCTKCQRFNFYINDKIILADYVKQEVEILGVKEADKIHFIRYFGPLKNCPNCKTVLKKCSSVYYSAGGHQNTCEHLKCYKCKTNYVDVRTYDFISKLGNKNVILDSKAVIDGSSVIASEVIITKNNINNKSKFEDVFVYKSINNTCKKNHKEYITQIPVIFYNLNNKMVKSVNAFYCSECNKKFITLEVVSEMTNQMYMPQFRCIPKDFLDGFKKISILAIYGYNVRANGLTTNERHKIIDYVIDNGIMHPTDVVALLQSDINLRKDNPSMFEACEKWREDIVYVQTPKR